MDYLDFYLDFLLPPEREKVDRVVWNPFLPYSSLSLTVSVKGSTYSVTFQAILSAATLETVQQIQQLEAKGIHTSNDLYVV